MSSMMARCSLLFVLSLPLSLGACGGDDDKNGTTDTVDTVDAVETDTGDPDSVTTTIPPDTAEDTTVQDTTPVDTTIAPGAFGSPCQDAEECDGGYCVEGRDSLICTRTCITECPGGFACRQVAGGGLDATFICVDVTAHLCQPCSENGDCNGGSPAASNLCVSQGDRGAFCGVNCGDGGSECPSGYACETIDGAAPSVARQCVPLGNVCECGGRAIELGLSTGCGSTNDAGRCAGTRTCTTDGLSDCDAQIPAPETCNAVDDNCDGRTDEDVKLNFYEDFDEDAYGNPLVDSQACEAPTGYVLDNTDCDDQVKATNPGAPELCSTEGDDNCDGASNGQDSDGCTTYYYSRDGDAFGLEGDSRCLCLPAVPYSAPESGDCNDLNSSINPDAGEVCNGFDDNCDNRVDEVGAGGCDPYYEDIDLDGYGSDITACLCGPKIGFSGRAGDCDDTLASVNPGAREVCFSGSDDNCDMSEDTEDAVGCDPFYYDLDADSYGLAGDRKCLCEGVAPYVGTSPGDCDDNSAARFPTNLEICDSLDNNCNGSVDEGVTTTYYRDDDGDDVGGLVTLQACPGDQPGNYKDLSGDCNDYNNQIFPGQTEVCNDLDDDCNGPIDDNLPLSRVYVDLDGDAFGARNTTGRLECLRDKDGDGVGEAAPDGFSLVDSDCNDTGSSIYPDAPELCDAILNDCNAPSADFQCPEVCAGSWPYSLGVDSGYVVVGQLDGDSEREVVVQGNGSTGPMVHVLEHDGSVKWTAAGSVQYSHPSLADMDGDGYLDVVLHETGRYRILKGTTGAELESFSAPGTTGWRPGIAFDLNNDGHLDLVGAPGSGRMTIVLRDGAGGGTTVTVTPPSGSYFGSDVPAVVDIEGDGIAEIMVGTGYYTCNGGNAPACDGRLLVYDAVNGTLKLDLLAGDNLNAYTGGQSPFVADLDADGVNEMGQYFGNNADPANAGVYGWELDGTPLGKVSAMGTSPSLAAIDTLGDIVASGQLRDIGGAAVDIDNDGRFETIQVTGDGIRVLQSGAVMDGYPVSVGGGTPVVGDINRDGRLDVLYVGNTNASVNCYTMGNQTYSRDQVLTYGGVEVLGGNVMRTASIDPYEPNNKAGETFDPTTSTNPVFDARAVSMRGFFDFRTTSSGETRELVAMIGTQNDVDYYWGTGSQISTFVEALGGPAAFDLRVHMYRPQPGGTYAYITTRDGVESGNRDTVTCIASEPCPDAANAGTKLFLLEVSGEDPGTDYGPWPYRLRISFGVR